MNDNQDSQNTEVLTENVNQATTVNSTENTSTNNTETLESSNDGKKDLTTLLNPTNASAEEFHLINKKDLPKKKNRFEGYEYKPPSKFKYALLVIFMIIVVILVIFMPEIDSYVKNYLANRNKVVEDLTTGRLICKNSSIVETFTYERNKEFTYEDNKLKILNATITIKGSVSLDSEGLNKKYEECQTLSKKTDSVSGVTVTCTLNADSVVQKQIIDYSQYEREKMIEAFVSANEDYPQYELGDDIDTIQKSMVATSYVCEKAK